MSQPHAEDLDPLLEFSIEPGAAFPVAPPPEPAAQPVAPQVDPPPSSPSSIPLDVLVTRIDRLERALDDSKVQVSTLRSEVATLVRVIGDIRKQSSPAAIANPVAPRTARSPKAALAIVGMLLGLGAGVFGWMYLTSDVDTTIVASAPAPPPEVAPEPAPAAPAERAAPVVMPARSAPIITRVAAPVGPVHYVGTLSIDAQPGGEVFVNRESAGHTPVRLTNLRAGSHLIWVEREGYRRWTRVVQVPADRVTRLSAELEPIAPR